jgi:hypothetical protein
MPSLFFENTASNLVEMVNTITPDDSVCHFQPKMAL